ncbi:hypothetical protein FGO68_gene12807 [Halteria grandinella]|uniref:Uncharacterized protein n=1 Tax=Halteria grandinella TaxID=5974 RepID=A0A8J8NIM8_HALGN|nr:hypothetical protein FGO68_gene12807 [Halteria grandinella]
MRERWSMQMIQLPLQYQMIEFIRQSIFSEESARWSSTKVYNPHYLPPQCLLKLKAAFNYLGTIIPPGPSNDHISLTRRRSIYVSIDLRMLMNNGVLVDLMGSIADILIGRAQMFIFKVNSYRLAHQCSLIQEPLRPRLQPHCLPKVLASHHQLVVASSDGFLPCYPHFQHFRSDD